MTCPTTPECWREISDQFMEKSGSVYYNYKGFYSIMLMTLVDADYEFLWADVSSPGAEYDAQIYNEPKLKEMAEDGPIGFPAPDPLPNDYKGVPYFFIIDDAFGLRKYMMKPYTLRGLQMKRGSSITYCPEPGRVLNMSLAFWQTASRFFLPQCSTTHPPSR